jgi:hypothetical protein
VYISEDFHEIGRRNPNAVDLRKILQLRLNQLFDALYCINRNGFDFIVLDEILMGDAETAAKISFV